MDHKTSIDLPACPYSCVPCLPPPPKQVTSTCTTFLDTCGHDWEEIQFEGRTAYMAAEFLEPC